MGRLRYLVVYEQRPNSWGATVPDLNVFSAGDTLEEVQALVKDAVAFHIEGLRGRGEPVPEPSIVASGYLEVA
jgi:predicted RNase H-like HicB family nuclease